MSMADTDVVLPQGWRAVKEARDWVRVDLRDGKQWQAVGAYKFFTEYPSGHERWVVNINDGWMGDLPSAQAAIDGMYALTEIAQGRNVVAQLRAAQAEIARLREENAALVAESDELTDMVQNGGLLPR